MKFKWFFIIVMVMTLVGCEIADESSSDVVVVTEDIVLVTDSSEMFTSRDLIQTVSEYDGMYELNSGEDLEITESGTYLISGEVYSSTIVIDVDKEENVQLVLDDVSIVNDEMPGIYVVSADKVFVTLSGDNYIEVNGSVTLNDVNLDAAIFSKEDLVINGVGTLEVKSLANGITSKDDLKITGGEIIIDSSGHGLEANDSIRIFDGVITIDSDNDALHSENEDEGLGYIYICGGSLDLTATDDAIRANTYVQIEAGSILINNSYEGIEATQVYINGGVIDLYASDDGLNATRKTTLDVMIVITGGEITIEVGSGDTDGIDSNGDLTITGGLVDITAPTSSIDVDGTVVHSSGTVIVNGSEVDDASQVVSSGGGMRKR